MVLSAWWVVQSILPFRKLENTASPVLGTGPPKKIFSSSRLQMRWFKYVLWLTRWWKHDGGVHYTLWPLLVVNKAFCFPFIFFNCLFDSDMYMVFISVRYGQTRSGSSTVFHLLCMIYGLFDISYVWLASWLIISWRLSCITCSCSYISADKTESPLNNPSTMAMLAG
jgi:hypothetical protein